MWENSVDLVELDINRAKEENIEAEKGELEILPIDDHKIHIDEHTAYILGSNIKKQPNYKQILEKLLKHIDEHKKLLN